MPNIFHPSDLGNDGDAAFLLALRLTVASHSVLTVMHVSDDDEIDPGDLPAVRSTLARWGLIADADDRDGFKALQVGVRKVIREGSDPVRACLDHLDRHATDLIVLSTHQGEGLRRRRVAEPLGRGAGVPTLFIPRNSRGLVDPATGAVGLRRVLIPVDRRPDPRRSIEAAMVLVESLGIGQATFTLLHVGDAASAPRVEVAARDGWTFAHEQREGEVVPVIVAAAQDLAADVVVMGTQGHDGFLDALRGSTTERVLRAVNCPVLAVPA